MATSLFSRIFNDSVIANKKYIDITSSCESRHEKTCTRQFNGRSQKKINIIQISIICEFIRIIV